MIRPATSVDTDRLLELAEAFFLESPYPALLDFPRERLRALVDVLTGTHGVIFVDDELLNRATGELRLVGLIAVVVDVHLFLEQPAAEEICFYVEPDYRSEQRGAQLLDAAEAWARARGCAFLRCSEPWGTGIGAFYAEHGYQAIETAYHKTLGGGA